MRPEKRRTPGGYSGGSQNDQRAGDSFTADRTARRVTGPLAAYVAGRERVLGGRTRISSDPVVAAADLLEVMSPTAARSWLVAVGDELGGLVPVELLVALSRAPAAAQELAMTRDPARQAALIAGIEEAVVDVLRHLAGGAA